jgi:crossover junction endodeoxyribonuclease RuvC
MAIGQAQAVAMLAASEGGIPVFAYSPRAVKQAVTDHGGSTKEQVQDMVRVLLGSPDLIMKLDASDALAVAICHVNAHRAQNLEVLN